MKQMRHWSLMRMLRWPLRSSFNCSRRLPGGTRSDSMDGAASMILSFQGHDR